MNTSETKYREVAFVGNEFLHEILKDYDGDDTPHLTCDHCEQSITAEAPGYYDVVTDDHYRDEWTLCVNCFNSLAAIGVIERPTLDEDLEFWEKSFARTHGRPNSSLEELAEFVKQQRDLADHLTDSELRKLNK